MAFFGMSSSAASAAAFFNVSTSPIVLIPHLRTF
jgi:hypothetical protein